MFKHGSRQPMLVMVVNFWKLRQGNCLGFESSLGYRVRLYFILEGRRQAKIVGRNESLSMAVSSWFVSVCVCFMRSSYLKLLRFLLFPSGTLNSESHSCLATALLLSGVRSLSSMATHTLFV